jgi:hypothetical protein
MYSRQEASQLRQEFWTAFGHYMQPLSSADGLKINWVNYKTGQPHISFRMEAVVDAAYIGIVLSHADAEIRMLFYEQFAQLKHLLHNELGEEWLWEPETKDEQGRPISKIYTRLCDVNLFRREDWSSLISFFKSRIIALDQFWDTAKYVFDALR